MKVTEWIEIGDDYRHGSLWLVLREVAPDLPEPAVELSALRWDTQHFELRIELPDALDKFVSWEARRKRSSIRTSGRGNPVSCPALALWLGRLCGEASR